VAAVEVMVAAAAAVLLDLGLPTVVLLSMAVVSVVIRRTGFASPGVQRVHRGRLLAGKMLLLAAVWPLVSQVVFIPIANHVSGQKQDVSDFAGIQGSVGMLAGFVLLSWTLAALGEELAYRGYLLTRITDVVGTKQIGVVIAIGVSSLLFGLGPNRAGHRPRSGRGSGVCAARRRERADRRVGSWETVVPRTARGSGSSDPP
jgi:uncharacterized protein